MVNHIKYPSRLHMQDFYFLENGSFLVTDQAHLSFVLQMEKADLGQCCRLKVIRRQLSKECCLTLMYCHANTSSRNHFASMIVKMRKSVFAISKAICCNHVMNPSLRLNRLMRHLRKLHRVMWHMASIITH